MWHQYFKGISHTTIAHVTFIEYTEALTVFKHSRGLMSLKVSKSRKLICRATSSRSNESRLSAFTPTHHHTEWQRRT